MPVSTSLFGMMPSGENVDLHTLANHRGASLKILNLGGIVFELNLPDRDGNFENITTNLETVDDYLNRSPHFGTLVGRFANRIAGAKFTLDGKEYAFPPNNGENLLHGGKNGFNKVLWDVEPFEDKDAVGAKLSLTSDEQAQGFPGTVNIEVTYRLTDQNAFEIDYSATADKATPINLTQHAYFNLSAFRQPTICDEIARIDADFYVPVGKNLIPTGEILPVEGTPLDFRSPARIGERLELVGDAPKGYDHCYVVNRRSPGELSRCAFVSDPFSGRTLELWTTAPGVQFYTGNFLTGELHAFGRTYPKHAGFCLETQHFPDSPNQPSFPDAILRPGETYRHASVFKFGF